MLKPLWQSKTLPLSVAIDVYSRLGHSDDVVSPPRSLLSFQRQCDLVIGDNAD
jgi:hypothetical protein